MKMKYIFKFVICGLLLFAYSSNVMGAKIFPSEKYGSGFKFKDIDSIVIMTIDPMSIGFGPIIYDRGHFDEIFDYFTNPQRYTDVYKFVITSSKEKMLISSIINNLTPYRKDEIEVFPDDVKISDGIDWKQYLHAEWQTNDPIETRTRVQFYMKDGDIITAFASSTSFDIFNYRYKSPSFSEILRNYLWYFSDEAVINNSSKILELRRREHEL